MIFKEGACPKKKLWWGVSSSGEKGDQGAVVRKYVAEKKATSIMEYMALLLFLMAALYIFQFYVVRAISGHWKKAGDTFGGGKQYDPRAYGDHGEGKGTLECFFENTHCENPNFIPGDAGCVLLNRWVSTKCFREKCDCTIPAEGGSQYNTRCWLCLREQCSEDQLEFGHCKDT